MGMFDYLICEMPLPDYPFDQVYTFQTKCTPCQCMTTYKITEDGSIWVKRIKQEWVEADNFSGGYFKETDAQWVLCEHYNGIITFYDYYPHQDYSVEKSDEFDIGCIEYEATVVDSKVVGLVCTKNNPPVHLSPEEVNNRRQKCEEARRANRRKMMQYRKDHPSPIQQFVDDIDAIIQNKPAVYDQSDLAIILNKIETRVSEWRKANDPWHEINQQDEKV